MAENESSIFDLVGKEEAEKMLGVEKPKKNRAKIGVTNSALNLREEPNSDSDILYVIPKGKAIVINGEDDKYYKVTVEGLSGYCMKVYVDIK